MTPSSDTSSTFRIDWRPSRVLLAALMLMAVLSAIALALSDLAPWAVATLSILAITHALRLTWREARRPASVLVLTREGARLVSSDGLTPEPLHDLRWHLRGPIAVLWARHTGGRRLCLSWWPDTLPPTVRRQLRLARDLGFRYDKPLPSVAA